MILYTDFDPACCAWITELIRMGEIPAGEVWCKPIQEIQAHELSRFHQVHLFAGLAGWARAGQIAGLGADDEYYSCSCPCPPFSSAAKKKSCVKCGGRPFPCPWLTGYFTCGECDHSWLADERHLWPEAWRLIAQCRPPAVVGEQVASDDGLIWLAGVRATLEIAGYGLGACDYPAAGVASPNLRQRLFWMAESDSRSWQRRTSDESAEGAGANEGTEQSGRCGVSGWLEHAPRDGRQQRRPEPGGRSVEPRCELGGLGHASGTRSGRDAGAILGSKREGQGERLGLGNLGDKPFDSGPIGRLANTHGRQSRNGELQSSGEHGQFAQDAGAALGLGHAHDARPQGRCERGNGTGERVVGSDGVGFWSNYTIIPCGDGKSRRVERGVEPLVNGVSGKLVRRGNPGASPDGGRQEITEAEALHTPEARVMRLRGYGNAINPYVAARFIHACGFGAGGVSRGSGAGVTEQYHGEVEPL